MKFIVDVADREIELLVKEKLEHLVDIVSVVVQPPQSILPTTPIEEDIPF